MSRFAPSLCLALTLFFVLHGRSRAEFVIDNFSETGGPGYGLNTNFFSNVSNTVGQQFNTGGLDYQLQSISVIIISDTPGHDFTAQLLSTMTSGQPGAALTSLSLANNPIGFGFRKYTFTPDSSFVLDGQTDYFFSIKDNLSGNSGIVGSVPGSNNSSGPGQLFDAVWLNPNSNANWQLFGGQNALLMQVNAVPEPSSLILSLAAGLVFLRRRRMG